MAVLLPVAVRCFCGLPFNWPNNCVHMYRELLIVFSVFSNKYGRKKIKIKAHREGERDAQKEIWKSNDVFFLVVLGIALLNIAFCVFVWQLFLFFSAYTCKARCPNLSNYKKEQHFYMRETTTHKKMNVCDIQVYMKESHSIPGETHRDARARARE